MWHFSLLVAAKVAAKPTFVNARKMVCSAPTPANALAARMHQKRPSMRQKKKKKKKKNNRMMTR